MKTKRIVGIIALLVIFIVGVYGVVYMYNEIPLTYDGKGTDVTQLYENPTEYDNSDPDGVAGIIVNTNLEQTRAVNAVAAIVFDYRGYDTIGESFILLTAISGSFIILRTNKEKKEEGDDETEE